MESGEVGDGGVSEAMGAAYCLIGELAQDASLYLARGGSGRYHHVLPFVWDDSRRTEEYAKFLQGLEQMEGIVHPVIIARPGQMIASSRGRGRAAPEAGDQASSN
ncbi:hypothetical protein P0D69_01705 [Paraburkholderia sediminicola]|uniref:PD-(D/E)XK nuclease domain-containing protein n=1 Tax=Paraburkholderia sediminicola TaxID=458836 RepID=UPI0038BCAC1B